MDQGTARGQSDLVELGVPLLVVIEKGDAGVGAGAGADGVGVGADKCALGIEVAYVVACVLTAPHRSETNVVVDAGSVPLSVLVG